MCRIMGIKLNCFFSQLFWNLYIIYISGTEKYFLSDEDGKIFFFFVVCFTAKYVSKRMTPHQISLINTKKTRNMNLIAY